MIRFIGATSTAGTSLSFGTPATTAATLSFGAPAAAVAAPAATSTPAFGTSNTLSFGAQAVPAKPALLPTFGASIQPTNASTASLPSIPTGINSNKMLIMFFFGSVCF